MFEIKGINEECGIFAVANNEDAVSLTYYGLHSLQHRGQQAAGMVYLNEEGEYTLIKDSGLVNDVFSESNLLENKASDAIGHVRYATASGAGRLNIQPFCFKFFDETISCAHNGFIGNAKLIKQSLEERGSVFSSTSDGEVIIHLLRREIGTFMERLKRCLIMLDGAFAYVILHDSGVYGVRDRYGLRPLSIGQLEDGTYILASETCAFNVLGAKFIRDVNPGEIVHIKDKTLTSVQYAYDTSYNMCLMEYVYFSRPDSSLDGSNVHFARKLTGKILAQEAYIDADIVVGVPDSSLSAANGYAEEAKLPYEMGLIKNRYVGRTFIQPTQALRERGVKMKLSALSEIVSGKKIILVDDSIVRGTTCKRIVKMLKEAGAQEVHVRIASPAIKYPCYYGVDISTYDELISSRLNVDEVCDYINADSLAFLSLDGLKSALLQTKQGNFKEQERYCHACFSGEYVTSLYEDLEDLNRKKEDK